jgi:hypothetical protein
MSTITFPARPSKLGVKVEDFRRWRSNTLFRLCTILIPEVRLRLIDLTVHENRERRWCGLPARPQLDKEGQARRDDRGKVAYFPVIQFADKGVGDAFSDRVIEALLESHPHAFDAEEPAR